MAAVSEQVGLRNQLRARWRALPEQTRWLITITVQFLVVILCWLLDNALGYGAAVIFSVLWLRRLPPLPWRLAAEAAMILIFVLAWAIGTTNGSVGVVFAIAFLLSWIPDDKRRWVLPAAVLLLGVAYPFFAARLFTIPVFGSFPDVPTGTYMVVFMMMAVGLNIVVGYAGLLDLGYVAFYATGAYTAGWFASAQFAGQKCPNPKFSVDNCPVAAVPKRSLDFGGVGIPVGTGGLHLSIFLVILIAGLITALFGIVIGLPTLRLRGDYLAIVTLGFGEILPQIARNGDNLGGFNLTNGANGITPIDSPGFGNTLSKATDHVLPANYLTCCHTLAASGTRSATRTCSSGRRSSCSPFTVFCSLRLRDSRLGRAWVAIREDETAAAAMGIPLMRTKTLGVCERRVLRRCRRAPTTPRRSPAPSPTTSSSTSRSSSSAWSSWVGWGTSGGS